MGRDGDRGTGLEVVPLTTAIGAEIRGVDLRRSLDPESVATIRQALLDHLVVFFRDQDISPEQQLTFASHFGDPMIPSGEVPPAEAGIDPYFAVLEDTPDSPPKADFWHTDVAFAPMPPDIAVLAMVDTPPLGGDTLWLNLYRLYDDLSPAMREVVSLLDLELDLGAPLRTAVLNMSGEDEYQRMVAATPVMRHPLVRIHPETGRRALYLCGAFMRGISGMDPADSAVMLDLLRGKLADPNLQVRWRWRRHDVAMWDERCTNHRANSDHAPGHRLVRRCLVGRDVPVGPRGPGGHVVT
ncbi:MAG TPA: TauD/TfdA family dioxygenase [Acidimicrobiales bacterium]|nr:TauD/TfdA family dioxygenase [Acidimicrobiales bacterium]